MSFFSTFEDTKQDFDSIKKQLKAKVVNHKITNDLSLNKLKKINPNFKVNGANYTTTLNSRGRQLNKLSEVFDTPNKLSFSGTKVMSILGPIADTYETITFGNKVVNNTAVASDISGGIGGVGGLATLFVKNPILKKIFSSNSTC